MLRSSYDVVIVGTDLPALVFGALAAKKGYRILVLGHGGKDNVYVVEGHHFVRRPHLLFGFADSNPIREVFRELALAPEMRNLPRPMSPSCSVALPEARVEVTHMKGVLEEEIAREFESSLDVWRDFTRRLPELETGFDALLRDCPVLPPGGIREYFAFRRYRKAVEPLLPSTSVDSLAPLAGDPRLRHVLAAPVAAISGVAEPWTHPLPFIRLANHVLRGFSFVEWGLDALKSLFLERILSNSGDVRPKDWVDTIIVKRGRVREVEVRAHDETIGAGALVAGTDLGGLLDLIPPAAAKKRYRARIDKVAPAQYLVTTNIAARRGLIPEGMARTAFVVEDPSAPLEGGNLLVVQVDPAMQPEDTIDPEWATISVSGIMAAAAFNGSAASVEAFAQRNLASLRRFLPFLDTHATHLSTAAITTDPKTGQPAVDMAGMVPIYGGLLPRSLDLATWPVRTAYKNVLFLGDAAAGALGFEGAFIAAFQGFTILRKLIEKKNVL